MGTQSESALQATSLPPGGVTGEIGGGVTAVGGVRIEGGVAAAGGVALGGDTELGGAGRLQPLIIKREIAVMRARVFGSFIVLDYWVVVYYSLNFCNSASVVSFLIEVFENIFRICDFFGGFVIFVIVDFPECVR